MSEHRRRVPAWQKQYQEQQQPAPRRPQQPPAKGILMNGGTSNKKKPTTNNVWSTRAASWAELRRKRRRRAAIKLFSLVCFLTASGILVFESIRGNLVRVDDIDAVETKRKKGIPGAAMSRADAQQATKDAFGKWLRYHTCTISSSNATGNNATGTTAATTTNTTTPYTMLESPSLVLAGAQKSGTTAVAALLRKHPNLVSSRREETHFFDLYVRSTVRCCRRYSLLLACILVLCSQSHQLALALALIFLCLFFLGTTPASTCGCSRRDGRNWAVFAASSCGATPGLLPIYSATSDESTCNTADSNRV